MFEENCSRRRFLGSCGALGLGAFLVACSHTRKPLPRCSILEPGALVPQRAKRTALQSFVGIDMHCHIFNGHDVPLSEFLTGPVLHFEPPLDALLSLITEPVEAGIRMYALSAADEYAALCELVSSERAKAVGEPFSIEDEVRSEIAVDDLRFAEFMARTANDSPEFRRKYRSLERDELQRRGVPPGEVRDEEVLLEPEEIMRALRDEPPYRQLNRYNLKGSKVSRVWVFLRRFWARRYHNAYRLLELYGASAEGPQVEVFIATPVDFDVPLKASPPSSRLEDQLKLMEAIAVLTGGHVLPFVPFDPRRDVEYEGEAFHIVKQGVTEYGCIGVKLYPPMGFKAFGNEGPDPGCDWPSDDYGNKLDRSLTRLFSWCRENEVPILAHSSESNGVSKACQHLGGPEDWRTALQAHPGLQVSVGHFGGDTKNAVQNDYVRTRGFATLMREPYATDFYADVSYMPGIFEPDSKLGEVVEELQSMPTSGAVTGSVSDRLLYGSDWFMIAFDSTEADYVHEMADYFRRIGGDPLVAKVFGGNAVKYFRLAKRRDGDGNQLRRRLDAFFTRHQLSPEWLLRVDALM